MPRAPIPLPVNGVAEVTSTGVQPEGTCRAGTDVVSRDPLTGRVRPAQRHGQTKHTVAQVSGTNKVQRVVEFGYDLQNVTFASRGNDVTVDTSAILPAALDGKVLVRDRFGDIYVIDGNAGVAKYNQQLVLVWKVAAPTKDPAHVCRALYVDSSRRVFLGVSEGGDAKKARVFVWRQVADNKTEFMYELETDGAYVESIRERDALVYMAMNDTRTWRSRVRAYVGVEAKNPTSVREWSTPYPINGMDISPFDGSVALAHGPTARRGLSPQSPETTGSSIDWDPSMYQDSALRLWAWWKADDVDGDGSNNSQYADGDEVEVIADATGHFRSWFVRAASGELGGTLRKGAVAGRDAIFFNGRNNSYQSEGGVVTDRAYRQLNRSAIPTYDGAQFALFMAVRVPASEVTDTTNPENNGRRWIFGNAKSTTAAENRGIFANASPNGTMADTALYGNLYLHEDTTNQPTANDRAQGTGDMPLSGFFNEDGVIILTWVFDGGIDDVASVPTRSCLYVNGRPCDRWHSWSGFANILPCFLGWAENSAGTRFEQTANTVGRMLGDFLEGFVLSDWETTDFGLTAAATRQRLLTLPTYPDAIWTANGDTDLERGVGYLAHKWGAAHKLPSGYYGALQVNAAITAAETVTVDAITYTWRAALVAGGAANEVLIGGSSFASLRNLCKAINGSGIAGTDYGVGTSANTTVRCVGVTSQGENLIPTLLVQARDGRGAAYATTETMAGAGNQWVNGATAVDTRNSPTGARGGYNTGHYPHSFYLFKTTRSAGGPPREAGVTATSIPGALISPYGMTSVWDPANGKVTGVITSNGPGTLALPVGGVGYGVRYNSAGDLYCAGPRQAATSLFVAENVDARKIVRTAAGTFNLVNGATANDAWASAPGPLSNEHPLMDVDKWDNVFLPMDRGGSSIAVTGANWTNGTFSIVLAGAFAGYTFATGDTFLITAGTGVNPATYTVASKVSDNEITLTADINGVAGNITDNSINGTLRRSSFVGYKRIAPSNALDAALIVSATNLPNDPRGYALVVDTSYPDFPLSFTQQRPEFVYLATLRQGSQQLALFKVSLVSRTQSAASPRARVRVAVSNGDLVSFTGAGNTLLGSGMLDANARYIDYAAGYGKLVLVDGRRYVVYDPKAGTVSNLRSRTAGQIPLGARLANFYSGRLWLACFNDDPHNMAWSKRGDINDWDFNPRVPTVESAIDATAGALGRYPDVVRGIANIEDDLGIILGDSSMYLLRGDPAEAGRFDQISGTIGGVWGRGWCVDDRKRFWWINNEGQLCYLNNFVPVPVSDDRLQHELRQIDFANFYCELVYNPEDQAIHIWLFPYGAGDSLVTHYTFFPAARAFWRKSFGTTAVQPTAACVINGDAAVDRRMLVGTRGGWINTWDPAAKDDDGVAIGSFLLVGPLNNTRDEIEAAFDDIEVVLASDQGGAIVEVYVTDVPDMLGEPRWRGRVEAGRNRYIPRCFAGNYVAIGIRGLGAGTRWALDGLSANATRIGEARRT